MSDSCTATNKAKCSIFLQELRSIILVLLFAHYAGSGQWSPVSLTGNVATTAGHCRQWPGPTVADSSRGSPLFTQILSPYLSLTVITVITFLIWSAVNVCSDQPAAVVCIMWAGAQGHQWSLPGQFTAASGHRRTLTRIIHTRVGAHGKLSKDILLIPHSFIVIFLI